MHNTTSHGQGERPRCPQKGLREICRSADDDISKRHNVRQTLPLIPPRKTTYETPPCLSVSTKLSLEYCFCDAWTRSGGGRDSDEINQITVLKKAQKDEYPRCSVAQQ